MDRVGGGRCHPGFPDWRSVIIRSPFGRRIKSGSPTGASWVLNPAMLYPYERRWLRLLWLFTLGLVVGGAEAAPYRDEASGTVFPDKVGGLRRGKVQPYEAEPGQSGVAIVYEGAGAPVTIYVRRLKPDSPLTAQEALKEALAGIRQLEDAGSYKDLHIHLPEDAEARPGWAGAAFTAKFEGDAVASWIYCRVRPGFLFKVRATTGAPANAKLAVDLAALLRVIDGEAPHS